jgi:microcystin-dependent protein
VTGVVAPTFAAGRVIYAIFIEEGSMEPFVAEIRLFPYNLAPVDWAACDGALLPIVQYTALFSLNGTLFGGDGQTNFALPNLTPSPPLAPGQSQGGYFIALNGVYPLRT